MSRLAFCTRTILLDPDDLAAVRRHVEIAGDEEVGVRTFLAELTGELEGLRVQLGAQGFDVAVQRRSAPEEPPALIATSLQTGKTSRTDLKKPAKEREAETGDLFGGTAPTAPAEAARNWQAEGEAAFKAGKSRMVPADIWKGVSAKEGNKRADAWFKGWDRANLAAPVAAAPPKRLTPVATREQFIADMMAGGRVTAKGRTFSLKDRGKLGWTVIEHNDGYNVEKGPGPMETWAKGFAAERAAEEVGLTPGTQQEQIATAPKEGIENGPAAGTGLREGSPAVSGTEQPGSAGAAAGSPGLSGTDGTGRGADAPAAFGPDAGGNQQPVQGPAGGDAGQVAGIGSDSGSGGRNRDDRADTAAVANNVEAGREIALPPNYRITEDDHIGEGGPKAKVAANLEALRLLKVLEAENRKATPSEQAVLVRYVGWGAFAQDMFQDAKPEWARERAELKGLLTTEEYESARASVLNAHYTSPDVIAGMWDAMRHLGFTGGRALEPASGVGHFIGMTPNALRDKVKWTATELDKVTGAIAQQLYQRADVNVQGFETLNRPNGFYDVAISNVPFGSFNIRDLRYKDEYLIHDYFFIRALDLVRPGGIVAFITSSGTMDKANDSARAEIMKRADLLGAIRLPGGRNGAFAGNAGTEVTTDIIFLRRKGERIASIGAEWQNLKEVETPDGPTRINEYFANNPDMMLGQMRLVGSMYRDKSPVLIGDAAGIRTKILAVAQKMPQNAFVPAGAAPVQEAKTIDAEASGKIKEGAFYIDGEKVMRKVLGLGMDPGLSAIDQDKVRRLVAMRDTVNDLLRVGRDRSGDAVARQRLNTLYDAFAKKYGPINRETVTITSRLNKAGENIVIRRLPNMSAFRADPDAYKVAAIENYDAEKDTATKAALFSGEVVSDSPAAEIKNAIDGIGWSLNAFGELNLTAIGDKIGKSKQQVIDELGDRIFLNPNGDRWEPAEQYLAGDVVEKLDVARAAAEADKAYERNVTALEAVQPVALTQEEITVPFGAPWVPASVYEQFLQEVIGTEGKARVSLNPVTKQYALAGVNFSISAQTQFGTSKVNVAEIISHALAMKTPRVTNTVRTETGTREEVDEEATREAQVKTQLVRKTFEGDIEAGSEGWVWQDADRGELLAKLYNRKFNRLVQQRFDGSHLTFPGLATKITDGSGNVIPFSLRQHQKDSVWRIVQNGNTLLDHVVGAGKTFTMIAGAMEMKRLGQIQRPMFVVPNHMLEQFSREFLQAYPNANILVAQKDEMTRANRKAFAAKIAAERWDGIVITHDAFGRLPLSKDVYVKFMKDEIAEIESAIRHMKAMQNKKDPTVKQLEQMKKRAETRMQKLIAAERKDEGVLFEELGVDQLIVDEAHLFKNLAFYTQHTRVKGLAQGASQRAMDLFLKVRELEKSRPGRSSIFATGTPISNTMAEMYTMQRYLQLDELVKLGVDRFDAWAATYGEIRTNMELSPDGRTFRETSSFSRFRNLPELVALYSKMADTKTADMLNLPRPKLKGGKPIIVEAEPSLMEEQYIQGLVKRAEQVRGKKAEKGGDNMLKVVSEGRKVALDYRLINPDYPTMWPDGKVAKLVNNVARIWRDGNDDPVAKAQLIFSDMGVPFTEQAAPPPRPESEVDPDEVIDDDADAEEVSADESEALRSRYNLYEEIRRQLVARGIPKQQVSFIHEAKDDSKKAALFEKVRRGEVRVLIGSTGKMGVGTNVQKRLKAMHHLDAPWKPAEVEQRDGRILRQGNMNPEIEIYRYITKRSFDSFMWQTLERKANFIAQIKAGARGVRVAEDIDSPLPEAAELKAAASGDPRIMQHAELTKEVRDLEAQFSSHVRTIGQARRDVSLRQEELSGLEKRLPKVLEDAAKVPVTAGDNFKVELLVGPKGTFTKRAEAGAVVAAFLAEQGSLPSKGVSKVTVARFNGLDIVVTIDTRQDPLALSMAVNGYNGRGVQFGLAPDRTPQLDAALMSRMESELADIPALKGHIEYRIEQIRKELPKIEAAAADRPFPRMERMKQAKQELSDLTKALSEDKNKKPAGPMVMGSIAEPTAPPFYSALLRTVEGLKMAKAPAGQWLATIKNQPGVRAEELAWLGVEEWLNGQPGAVTKEALADFIRANQVQVQEVVKGGLTSRDYVAMRGAIVRERYGDGVRYEDLSDLERAEIDFDAEKANPRSAEKATKFSQYQLPGGSNYRELLLTLPEKDTVTTGPSTAPNGWGTTEGGTEGIVRRGDNRNDYRSGHWSEPNVLAHVRFNEREVDGKRVLFIEEIQSDWHQQGRKKGYAVPLSKDEGAALVAERARLLRQNDPRGFIYAEATPDEINRRADRIAEISQRIAQSNSVPDAPFKTTWPELALKRMVRWAAENGFDQVAWTPGDVQAERYDLSKQVDSLLYKKNADGTYQLSAQIGGRGQMLGETLTEPQLEENVGKDVAEKIVKGEGRRTEVQGKYDPVSMTSSRDYMTMLSGVDLKVGGEGMKAFYDKMLVDAANKLGKKFGAKVGQTKIEVDQRTQSVVDIARSLNIPGADQGGVEAELAADRWWRTLTQEQKTAEIKAYQKRTADQVGRAVHTLPITPDMRRAAMQGLPLFETQGKLPPTQFIATRAQINAAAKEVDRLTQQMLGRKVKTFTNDVMPSFIPPEFIAAYGEQNRTIYVTMRAAHDLANNVGHESLHAMRQLGLISENEWTAMTAMAKKHGFAPTPASLALYRREYVGRFGLSEAEFADKIDEESVARLFGNYVSVREKLTPFARKVIDKLREWADAVLVAVGAAGVEVRARDFMARAYRGDVGNRPEGSGALALDQLAVAGAVSEVTQTPEFKAWFKGSKAVDANGEPLVVYHGTEWDIDSFFRPATADDAFYFTPDQETASWFAEMNMIRDDNQQPNVMPVMLSIQNPKVMTLDQLKAVIGDDDDVATGIDWTSMPTVVAQARREGHDGMHLIGVKEYNGKVADQWLAFESSQVKSVFNGGKFDPSNPMILGNAPDGSAGAGGGGVPPSAVAADAAAQAELDDLAGNINLRRIAAPDDIKDMLKQVADQAQGFMTERRGVVSNEQTAALAAELGLTAADLMDRKTGDAFNAHQIFAARVLLLKSAERVKKMAREAATSNSLSVLAEFQKTVLRHRAIQEQVSGMTAEAGRALQQFNMISGKDYLRGIDALVSGVKNNKASFGAKAKGDEEMTRELAGMLAALEDPAQLGKFIADARKPTTMDMLRELWINGLLSGPRTHAANILSNTLTALWQVPETAIASAIGAFHSGDRVAAGEAGARLIGLIEGTKEGVIAAAHLLKTGEPKDAISKIESHERRAIPGKVGSVLRTPSRLLEAEDQFFKAVNYRAEINALAVRQALKEGRKGAAFAARVAEIRANPSHKMQAAAHQAALYQTFQNKLGPKGQMIMNLREAVPLAWLILPFIRTPANVLKYAAERTPIGLAMKPVRDNLSGANGNVARDTQIARMFMGTALMVTMVSLVAAGLATGGGPDDPEEKRVLRATGWQPYSFKFGDEYVSYQRMDPLALVVGIAADMVEMWDHFTQVEVDKLANVLVSSIANNVKEKTWISGLVTFAEAFFSGDAWKLDAWGRRLGGSMVPALVAQYAQTQDPYVREARNVIETVKSRVPGWSSTLIARRDLFGEQIVRGGSVGPDIASPFFVSKVKDNALATEMLKLGYYPSMPDRTLAGHKLTAEQYDRYVELSGKAATAKLNVLIRSERWQRMDDDKREERIRDEFSDARKMARSRLRREWPELAKKAGAE